MRQRLPLLEHDRQGIVAWRGGVSILPAQFLGDVEGTAAGLPDRPYAVNLCEDRYHFLVAFAAVALRGQTNLLPSNRAPGTVRDLLAGYAPAYCLVDGPLDLGDMAGVHTMSLPATPCWASQEWPTLPGDQVVAVLFTSGSTGRPVPNPKRWADLRVGAELIGHRLGIVPRSPLSIVATVPPQHMYGLELSILQPLRNGVAVHGGRPLFPDDVCSALAEVAAPRLLVTTPAHVRALAATTLRWPDMVGIVSATAPLEPELARRAEQQLRAPLWEIFGCTEAGTMATRRTALGEGWEMLAGMQIHAEEDHVWVTGPQLPEAVPLSDVVELASPTRFRLLGRRTDQVNVAGKRASLADLNLKLLSIAGVEDGVFIVPEASDDPRQRLAALVVAPTLSEQEILMKLREFLDPAFLPRPLLKVNALPRAETGKLPRAELLALLSAARVPS